MTNTKANTHNNNNNNTQNTNYDPVDIEILTKIFEGNFDTLPLITSKIVRIFTSSTFTDTATERNSLMENVYPKLKEYCREKHGLEFQVVDMRWGVRDEATDDHKTTELCMQEIDNCQRLSLGPNFVVFLGQKYGYRPLPTRILENEFEMICDVLQKQEPSDAELLQTWYKLDYNSVPSVYVLQPVSSIFKNFTNKKEKNLMEEDQNAWWQTMGKLCLVIRKGAARLLANKSFTTMDNHRYNWSVTEQEVVRGILEAKDNTEHTLAFIREIKNINVKLFQHSAKFIDINFGQRKVDEEAQKMLSQLRDIKVPQALVPENIINYSIDWSDNEGINRVEHSQYIEEFSDTFYNRIIELIERALGKQKVLPYNKVYAEVLQHLHFCKSTTKLFQGRSEILEKIKNYVSDETRNQPFVLYGTPGCGKTSILARVAVQIKSWIGNDESVVLLRFLGTTPDSSSIFPLLKSVCSQLSFLYGMPMENIPDDLSQLVNHFKSLLKCASNEKPLFIFFDSLDQLSPVNSSSLSWLPISLPKYVKLIVSTLSGFSGILDTLKNIVEIPNNFSQVESLGQDLSISILNELLRNMNRRISKTQWPIIENALQKCNTPLYVKLVFDQVSLWKSYTLDIYLAPSISECISKLFERIENQHGKVLVSHALAYITASKNGLSEAELEDLISLDETVLNDIYQYHLPPIRRIPPLLWTRIRNDIPSYLSEREADGISVVSWYHKQFIEVSMERFLSNIDFKKYVHSQISDYFIGVWANVPKPFSYTEEQKRMFMLKTLNGEADRKVPAQPEIFYNPSDDSRRYNCRKLSELPYHLIRSKRIKELYSHVLFCYKFIFAKINCMPLNSVLADFEDYISNYKYNKEVALVSDALRLSSSILVSSPTNLAPQIIGRLFPYILMDGRKFANVKLLVEQCESEGVNDCALVPAYCTFSAPGGPLVFSIEGHPFAVYGIYLLNDGIQLVSVSNRFIIFDITSGDVIRVVNPQIEGIMQTLTVTTDRKFCISYTNNNQIVIWGVISNEIKVLNSPTVHRAAVKSSGNRVDKENQLKPQAKTTQKQSGVGVGDTIMGLAAGQGYFLVWGKYNVYVYNIKGKLIKVEKYLCPIIQAEIVQNDSIKCCGVEIEVISRTEDCGDDESKDRDYMLLEYKFIGDPDKFEKPSQYEAHLQQSNEHYIAKGSALHVHSALILNREKTRLYTCMEIADNFLECYKNKFHHDENKQKYKVWKYDCTLDENFEKLHALVLSENEKYLLAVVISGFKVFYLKTGQSKPLKLPHNIKNIQIGYKKLQFSAVFSKDNQYVIAAVKDKIYVYDTSYGYLIKTLDAHYGRITCLLGSTAELKDLVISSSMDKTIKVWNLKNILEEEFPIDRLEKPIERIHISTIASVALAQSRNQLALLTLKDGKIKRFLCHNPHGAIFNCSALTSTGAYGASSESNRLIIWDIDELKVTYAGDAPIPNNEIKQILFHNSEINILCVTLDTVSKDVTVINYAIPDGEVLYKFDFSLKSTQDFRNIIVNSDETRIIVFRNDKKVDSLGIYNTEDGVHIHNVKLQYPNYISTSTILVPFIKNENLVAVIDSEKGNVMNIKEKKFVRSIPKWNGKMTNDDKNGLYAPTRGGLEVIELKNGTKVKVLIPKIAEGVFDVDTVITESNTHVIYYHAGRRTIRVFRLEDGIQIADFKCPAKVKCMKCSQDSKNLIIGCEDGSVSLFLIVDPYDAEYVRNLKEWRKEQIMLQSKESKEVSNETDENILDID